MAAILNSAILDSAIFAKKTFTHSFSLNWWWQPSWSLPSWIQPFCTMILHSFILTQLDDGSHLGFSHLDFPLKLTHTYQDWFPPFAQKNFTDSFWLNLMMAAILNLTIIDSSILVCPSNSLTLAKIRFPVFVFAQKKLHSFILTHIGDGRHLEFCHVGFRHCHLGFRHLVFFSQIHSKTLSLHSDSDSN